MKKMNLEFKVGLFVVVALGLLMLLVAKAGDFYMKPGYTMRFVFKYVRGIDRGSPVKLAGVNVGEVKTVHVVRNAQGETQVEIEAWIAQGVSIEDDAQLRVNSLGFLGEKYLEILPGTPGSKLVADRGTLVGKAPLAMDDLAESGNRLMKKMETSIDSLNELVADPNFKSSVKATFVNLDKLSKDLMETTNDLKETARSAKVIFGRMRDGEGSLGRLLKDDKLARDLEAFVADVKAHPWKLLKRD
jgi:phospholipid/cholesterol/gamma-HCH transport system substrate-binding protein